MQPSDEMFAHFIFYFLLANQVWDVSLQQIIISLVWIDSDAEELVWMKCLVMTNVGEMSGWVDNLMA